MINLVDLWNVIRKYFVRIVAICLLAGILCYFVVSISQTYTCTLNYSYNYEDALTGLAPDGESELNPYELKNPAVLQAAIDYMGLDDDTLTVEGLRNKITISEEITTLDKEVSESAAVLGEKYEVQPTEFSVTYSYKAGLGKDFGLMLFDGIIRSYDDFIISKYYNKKHITDFMSNIDVDSLDYLEVANTVENSIYDIVAYLDDYSSWYPDFRSVRTGYSFDELAKMYDDLVGIQQAEYYANVRAGNLSKDPELVIANYMADIKELESVRDVNTDESNNYKNLITHYYENYKRYGLYDQATSVQSTTDSTNTNNFDVYRDLHDDYDKLVNTYDKIVQAYTDTAAKAASATRTISYYNSIIDSFENDNVSKETKEDLLSKNEVILEEIRTISKSLSAVVNDTLDELYDSRVAGDVQYLMSTDISEDKPVILITLFAMIAVGGISAIFFVLYEYYFVKLPKKMKEEVDNIDLEKDGVNIDPESLDYEQSIAYEQYKRGFEEFYLVYQPMMDVRKGNVTHFETFIRWQNEMLGSVSPSKIIELYAGMGIIRPLNDWIISQVCKDVPKIIGRLGHTPVIHINCLYSEIIDFGLNEILAKNVRKYKIPSSSICMELDGENVLSSLEDIITLKDMGIQICVDHFENKDRENEILRVIEPEYVKMSSAVFSQFEDSRERSKTGSESIDEYFTDIINRCNRQHINVCICGVENKEQDELVTRLGFRYKQGYYYGRPLRLSETMNQVSQQ